MPGKVTVVFALLVALLISGAAFSPDTGEAKDTSTLQQLLARREAARLARPERRAHLSEDEREIMTKQIMQAISEVMNSECMSDRDYQGWVDFGRRETE
ncbi:gastrin/cholecystokinin-like peptide [Echeneis naucrates]|uniref:Gastrin/cholecystokinin-like peptide n=1 Tax=Echeneis naucrates TaxID=173247 RepID=A0A665V6U9_ECHNA|nr:gastrin/cholecystokinin-like peptide [Echeneis naucrates]XP_029353201.1 gastrin/cholecystokinin-like peptide [Echeneis naucrates]